MTFKRNSGCQRITSVFLNHDMKSLKALSHLCGQALWASCGGQFLLPTVPRRKHTPVSISHGSRLDLPTSVQESPIWPQVGFEHAQNFVRVTCGYLHVDVIAKHQHEARKGRNLLVYIPLKESRLAVDMWPSRTRACHVRSYCELFTHKKMSLFCQFACRRSLLRTWDWVY